MAKRFGQKVSLNVQTKLEQNAPDLPQHLLIFFQAFKDLNTQRPVGFAVGYIPFLDIVTYAKVYDFSEELQDDLIYFVRGLDEHYIEIINKEQQKKTDSLKSKNSLNHK